MDRETLIRTLVSDRAKLLAYVWSIVRDDHVAEDLYQDVIVVAMGQIETFNDPLHVLKWSRVTLRNKALEHLRNKRSAAAFLSNDLLDVLDNHWTQHDLAAASDMTDALRHCLASLTGNARELVDMRYGQGMRGTDIAASTGKTPHSIYVALSRAYKSLGDCINMRMTKETRHA
jgi:RNA polymerase sigma-70 factor (ECF subfamily)